MNVTQIYNVVNTVSKQALGKTSVTAVDTSSFIALGTQVLSTEENIDLFYKALTDRIGRVVVAIREYKPLDRKVFRDGMEWGCILQKINYNLSDAVENPTWTSETQASPYDIESSIDAKVRYFSKMGTWSHEEKIPTRQLKHAFTSERNMGAFISGLYIAIDNAMNLEIERLSALAVNTGIATIFASAHSSQTNRPTFAKTDATGKTYRKLLTEYNALYGDSKNELTVADALTNTAFLKYATREINTVIKNMKSYSTVYNVQEQERHTSNDFMVVEVLGQFGSATTSYLEADTYHKELVSIDGYTVIPYWQGSGTSFAFSDCSKINVTNSELITDNNSTGTYEVPNVVAVVRDMDACASTMYDRRSYSIFNPRAEVNDYIEKADTGYLCDTSENMVVFTLN